MKKLILIVVSMVFSLHLFSQSTVKCVIKTSKGDIYLELYPEKAPVTVGNFLKYVDADLYTNSSFFRTCTPENEADRDIKIQVIQGGDVEEEKSFDPIKIETTKETSILHKHGTVSMARAEPNTATSSFFICINDQPELDFNGKRNPDGYGFAAFGQVIKGMDVVLEIQKAKNNDQYLVDPVRIISIERVK
ncbi:MAG: peptidylprolyl isomerase [Bacteroidota bacterium]